MLLVSHEHLDHADRDVARLFLDAGKPVLAPDGVWRGEPIHDRLTHPPRDGSVADLTVSGNANARWSYASTGVAQTTAGTPATFSGANNNGGYGTLVVNLPDGTTSAQLMIVSTNNVNVSTGSQEIWAIDDVSLEGTPIPEPASLGLVALAGTTLTARRRNHTK